MYCQLRSWELSKILPFEVNPCDFGENVLLPSYIFSIVQDSSWEYKFCLSVPRMNSYMLRMRWFVSSVKTSFAVQSLGLPQESINPQNFHLPTNVLTAGMQSHIQRQMCAPHLQSEIQSLSITWREWTLQCMVILFILIAANKFIPQLISLPQSILRKFWLMPFKPADI